MAEIDEHTVRQIINNNIREQINKKLVTDFLINNLTDSQVSILLRLLLIEEEYIPYKKRNIIQVGKDIYRNYGLRGFVRGWNIRVIHSCYHTIWVYGIGNIIFSWLRDEK